MDIAATKMRRMAPLTTPTLLGEAAARDIAEALTTLLVDVLALYVKTKNLHWYMSGPHIRDYHLMLDEHAAQVLAVADPPDRVYS